MKRLLLLNLFLCGAVPPLAAIEAEPGDFQARAAWLESQLNLPKRALPFSFLYDGVSSTNFLPRWTVEAAPAKPTAEGTERRLICRDPAGGLVIEYDWIEFTRHPALEWVIRFRNASQRDTPILSEVRALDTEAAPAGGEAVLHYARGATCSMNDFQPLLERLEPDRPVELRAGGGRSSSDYLPFFNLELGRRGGMLAGIGWSGEWAAGFAQDAAHHTRLQAGLALTHLKLRPAEEIRTPRLALLFYQGDWIRGQNLWRRFLLEHHRPKVNGRPVTLPVFNGNWGGTRAADHLANIEAIARHDLPVGYYWIDAEWFGDGPWFLNPGNWRVKTNLYPAGFKPLSDRLHESGRKLLLWFEPERVCEGTPWERNLSRWLLSLPAERRVYRWEKQTFPDWVKSESLRNQIKENDRLFNLAIPEAREFLANFISARITEFGLDCYRHDANIAPLEFWRAADAADRQGITEIRWVEGLYEFWDTLLRRHPHLLIDNCASGGRRLDLETLSRSVPLWRTDFPGNLTGKQCHTYGISFWVPLNSTGAVTPGRDSQYAWRSAFSSTVAINLFGNGDAAQSRPPPADFPYAQAKAALEQFQAIQPCFLGDYYPLTPYSQAADVWMAYQFHRDDAGEGFALCFRREQSKAATADIELKGLLPDATYELRFADSGQTRRQPGRDLARPLRITIAEAPGSALLTYRRVQN